MCNAEWKKAFPLSLAFAAALATRGVPWEMRLGGKKTPITKTRQHKFLGEFTGWRRNPTRGCGTLFPRTEAEHFLFRNRRLNRTLLLDLNRDAEKASKSKTVTVGHTQVFEEEPPSCLAPRRYSEGLRGIWLRQRGPKTEFGTSWRLLTMNLCKSFMRNDIAFLMSREKATECQFCRKTSQVIVVQFVCPFSPSPLGASFSKLHSGVRPLGLVLSKYYIDYSFIMKTMMVSYA